jgi:hypothetical protein
MRRPVLLTLAAVGGMIVLLGGTGIFAALSDTARSGTNSIDTNALPPSSDLRIADATLDPVDGMSCGSFSDDLTSALITISGEPGAGAQERLYCLRNVGSQWVNLTVQVEQVDDIEIGCTGDESIYDTSCGSGFGEVGENTVVWHRQISCSANPIEATEGILFRQHQTTPMSLGTLGPDETRCFGVTISQFDQMGIQSQQAQSDRLTWRFAWTGQV